MNLALERRKEELAEQYILDPRQKEIFLTKATQYKMWETSGVKSLFLTKAPPP